MFIKILNILIINVLWSFLLEAMLAITQSPLSIQLYKCYPDVGVDWAYK